MINFLDYIKIGLGAVFGGAIVWLFVISIYEPMIRNEERHKASSACSEEKSEMVSRASVDALAAALAQERRAERTFRCR